MKISYEAIEEFLCSSSLKYAERDYSYIEEYRNVAAATEQYVRKLVNPSVEGAYSIGRGVAHDGR